MIAFVVPLSFLSSFSFSLDAFHNSTIVERFPFPTLRGVLCKGFAFPFCIISLSVPSSSSDFFHLRTQVLWPFGDYDELHCFLCDSLYGLRGVHRI